MITNPFVIVSGSALDVLVDPAATKRSTERALGSEADRDERHVVAVRRAGRFTAGRHRTDFESGERISGSDRIWW